MCAAARTEFSFACNLLIKRWETTFQALVIASFGAYAWESHMAEALKHAEAAKAHAKTADEHLDAGITSLNDAIDHAKMKHADLAKKSAEEAVTHLKAAQ